MIRFILLLIVAARVDACVCGGGWPSVKQAWKQAPAVFLGTVEKADPDGEGASLTFHQQSVRIRVDETFKGVSNGQIVEMDEGANDCAAKFRTGERFVFYLRKVKPRGWSVAPCSHSLGDADPLGDDLLFLRGLPKSAVGTRLSGTVELYEDSAAQSFHRVGGVANVPVKISGAGGLIRKITTNADGVYEIFELPPGRYSVSIETPKDLKIAFPVITGSMPVPADQVAVELARDENASVGFVLKADTQLSGQILDAKGAPVASVCMELGPLEGRGENGGRFFGCTHASGAFEISMMPPGKYWLIARDKVKLDDAESTSTLYYPGFRDRQRASIVSIEPGQHQNDLDIRLPAEEKRYKITGRLQFSDGIPAGSSTVTFKSEGHGYTETTRTRADGTFALSVVAGTMDGQLSGEVDVFEFILNLCPQFKVEARTAGMIHFMDARRVSLVADSDHQGIQLEIPSPSCAAWSRGRK